ncbi:MAG TPA: hypothetical protein VNZ44_13470 [Pyrinomonadaceae bacterium]|nr:hypothetical protein [Pyrinomonadaceae bacterium]
MDAGTIIGYAVAFLVGLVAGRVWGGAAARKAGNMLSAPQANALPSRPNPLATPGNAVTHAPPDADFEEEVRRLAAAGNLINAIKLYRERTGCSLKDAKDAVERIRG